MRPTDQEITALKEEALTSSSLETGGMAHRATWGSTWVSQEAERGGECMTTSLYFGYCGKGDAGQHKRLRIG